MKRKKNWKALLRYHFDQLMSRATAAMLLLLFGTTGIIVFLFAPLAKWSGGGSLKTQAWEILMHMIDGGTITNDDTANQSYLFVMLLVSFAGLLVVSMLVGIISAGVERLFASMRKGTSTVMEEGHIIILGFTDSIYTLITSLVQNQTKSAFCIVVADQMGREKMEENVRVHVKDFKDTRMVYRSGPLSEEYMFDRLSVETARSILVNRENDGETIRIILALTAYLKEHELLYADIHITAIIRERRYVEAARLAGEGRAEIVFEEEALSLILAHTCGQNGVSDVIREMIDYAGNELYIEPVRGISGKTFREALSLFENHVVFGIHTENGSILNPPMDTVLQEGNALVLLKSDQKKAVPDGSPHFEEEWIAKHSRETKLENRDLLIIGWSKKIPFILEEYDHYVPMDTFVQVVSDKEKPSDFPPSQILCIRTEYETVEEMSMDALAPYVDGSISNVLLVTEDGLDAKNADTKLLLLLISLQEFSRRMGKHFCIISELQISSDQKLAALAGADDFVVDPEISILLAAQISSDRRLAAVFRNILDYSGSELYIKPVNNYVVTGKEVDFYTVTESAARKHEVAVGYKRMNQKTKKFEIITNPPKSQKLIFSEHDALILLAEDWFTF